jgi:hypothetical protein
VRFIFASWPFSFKMGKAGVPLPHWSSHLQLIDDPWGWAWQVLGKHCNQICLCC